MIGDHWTGVDVGGGGIRLAVRSPSGFLRAADPGPVPKKNGLIDAEALCERIARLYDSVASRPSRLLALAVGLTGMPDLLDDPDGLARALRRSLHASVVIVASDILTTHLGALSGAFGVVTAAGTGAISLGTNLDSVWNRTDGWGYLLGDFGSGAWIGARGLAAALRENDRAGSGSRDLLRAAQVLYGRVDAIIPELHSSPSPAFEMAQFAVTVAEAAEAGDLTARSIWHRAGAKLARSAVLAAEGVPHTFSWGGALFKSGALLVKPFREGILRELPDATVFEPQGTSVDGALLLAQRGAVITEDPRYVVSIGPSD